MGERECSECVEVECQDCYEHDDHDHGECLDCRKIIIDKMIMQAEYNWEGDR